MCQDQHCLLINLNYFLTNCLMEVGNRRGHDQLLKIRLSKKLLNMIFQLLDTIRANVTFFVNCSNPVNLWRSSGFEQFHFLTKKYQLLELQVVDKGFWKCQLLDTIYTKENGVHVLQSNTNIKHWSLCQKDFFQMWEK
jgi:hypothetical protein